MLKTMAIMFVALMLSGCVTVPSVCHKPIAVIGVKPAGSFLNIGKKHKHPSAVDTIFGDYHA